MEKESKKFIRIGWDDIAVSGVAYAITLLFAVLCIIPFVYVIIYSISPYEQYLQNPFSLLPGKITFEAYRLVLDYRYIWSGYKNTLFIAVTGTLLSMLILVLTAYPLTKKELKGRNLLLTLWIITMFFGGGMIPNYFLIRSMGLLNSLWSMVLPGLLGAYNLILMKNYIRGLPSSIEEAALIEGANDIQVLFKVVLPLCPPILATLGLFTLVGYWNSYFNAIIYITKRTMWPLQLVLREIVFESANAELQSGTLGERLTQPFTLKMAAIIVATVPIMCIYPFIQKYFMKGLILGGVKE